MKLYNRNPQKVEAVPFDGTIIDGLTGTIAEIDNTQMPFGSACAYDSKGLYALQAGDIILVDTTTRDIVAITNKVALENDYTLEKPVVKEDKKK